MLIFVAPVKSMGILIHMDSGSCSGSGSYMSKSVLSFNPPFWISANLSLLTKFLQTFNVPSSLKQDVHVKSKLTAHSAPNPLDSQRFQQEKSEGVVVDFLFSNESGYVLRFSCSAGLVP